MGGTPTYEDMVQLYVDCAGLNVESLKHHKECTGRTPPSPPPPNAAKEELSPPIDTTNFPYHRAMNVISAIWDAFEIALIPVVLAFVAALLNIIIFYLRILLKLILIKCVACCQFLTCWLCPTMGQSTAEIEMMAIEVEPLVPSPPTHSPEHVIIVCEEGLRHSLYENVAVQNSTPEMTSMRDADAGSFGKDEKLREYEERAYQMLQEIGVVFNSISELNSKVVSSRLKVQYEDLLLL